MYVFTYIRLARTRSRRPAAFLTALCALLLGLGLATPAGAQEPSDTALSWGINRQGELGDGSTDPRSEPGGILLPDGVTLTDVEAGARFGLGVTSEGRVLAWGDNRSGQLGDGTTDDRREPVEVRLPEGVRITDVSGGGFHSLALASDGRLFAWGRNAEGQLGDGSDEDQHLPVEVDLPPGVTVTAISAGNVHSLALTSDGRVLAWGGNGFGQLGDNSTDDREEPVAVHIPDGTTITAIAAGDRHSLALTSEGRVLAWGNSAFGQLGNGSTQTRLEPVEALIPAGTRVTAIAAGFYHSLAVTSEGNALAWGDNFYGQLGDGTTTDRHTPVDVLLPDGVTVRDVEAGGSHSLARTSDFRLLAWGENFAGALGVGDTTNRHTPAWVLIPAGETVADYSAGLGYSLALVGPPAEGTVRVYKTDKKTGEPLAGAVFRLWRETNGRPGLQTRGGSPDTAVGFGCATDADGRCTFDDLISGTYYVQETDVPEGYKLPKRRVAGPFDLDGTGETVSVRLVNERMHCPKGKPC
ncbi:hypothetical protein SRB5_44990 [Streptomyces sp. RB5]|uniref:Uncharacterized protein n=1 Tax=Streptomyces smaragdinus TaxID=2585196 RepID=A0A7K0CLH0_9ACTN|nr:SpaA isopeptide-forming pilin-related protein [Streptomyces smaragdinus]MQY14335.1 hypothetical protein [Streptomyces smaragdinus]